MTPDRSLFLSLVVLASAFSAAGQEIEVSPRAPDSKTSVTVHIFGSWADSCVPHDPKVQIDGSEVIITLDITVPPGFGCLLAGMDYRESVRVGTLAPGVHSVVVKFKGRDGTGEVVRTPLIVRDSSILVRPMAGSAEVPTPVFLQLQATLFLGGLSRPVVTFDGVPATAVSVIGDRMIQATPPPRGPGTVDVAVTLPNGTTLTAGAAFTYFENCRGSRS